MTAWSKLWLGMLVCVALMTIGQLVTAADAPTVTKWLTGSRFRQELEKPISVVFTRTDLRSLVSELMSNQHVSIILDRRQDSSAELRVDLKDVSLQTAITEIAHQAKGEIVVLENAIYCGPDAPTSRLRTLIELRKAELSAKPSGIPDRRRTELLQRKSFAWQDLDSPREAIEAIASAYKVKISNSDLIPHDLWAARTLPDTNLIEASTIILNQFDLTYQWHDGGGSMELVPVPERVWVERKIHPKQKLTEALALVHEQFPDLDVQTSNADLVVRGTIEECEAIGELLRGNKVAKPKKPNASQELRKQIFTFSSDVPVPLSLVMKKLEESSNVHFEYNADEFKDYGIDLDQLVDLNVTNEPTEVFFKRLFGPARIEFTIEQSTVKLTPKKRK